jgi:hypothetical protein
MNEASKKKKHAGNSLSSNLRKCSGRVGGSKGGCASKTCVIGLPRIKEGSPRC